MFFGEGGVILKEKKTTYCQIHQQKTKGLHNWHLQGRKNYVNANSRIGASWMKSLFICVLLFPFRSRLSNSVWYEVKWNKPRCVVFVLWAMPIPHMIGLHVWTCSLLCLQHPFNIHHNWRNLYVWQFQEEDTNFIW